MSTVLISTTTRAEWGLLRPFGEALQKQGIQVRVVVSGAHLADDQGLTVREVEESGLPIDTKIPILAEGDSAEAEAQTMGNALSEFGRYFSKEQPDALMLLGDRYETLAIAEAAFLARIPIIHVHGGEITEGAIDDAIRHCITKLSMLHLTSTEDYRTRVIQLGEDPSRVFNVGATGVENALNVPLLSVSALGESLGINLERPYAVMTYHPVTLSDESPVEKLQQLLYAAEERPDILFVTTKANIDAGGRAINEALSQFAESHDNLVLFDSLGSLRYLSAVSHAAFVIGNSSSGLLEAPVFCIPTVNIGDRQRGRTKTKSVIDCKEDAGSILRAIDLALDQRFRDSLIGMENPYGSGDTSRRAAEIIAQFLSQPIDLQKKFFDL